jgi:glycerol-3-phosphate dehydrogenase
MSRESSDDSAARHQFHRPWVPAPLHVLIIGGGIGGLTLAQGLKKSGVSVAVPNAIAP